MKPTLRTLTLALPFTLLLTACTTQELQKFTYNSGASIECRRANDNLPNETALNQDCLHQSGVDGMSHEEYLKEVERIKNEPIAPLKD
jgi:hypothetical protein